jgi:hypothetical protein
VTSTRNWRRRVLVGLVFVVAGAVLVESWHAAMNAAATGGRPWPWLWPATLEAFMAVLVLVYWDARSTHRKAPMARVLLAVTTGVASAVQILDAPTTALGWLTAGWTPVSLLATVEFAVWLLYGARARPDWPLPVPPDPEPVPVDAPADPTPDRPKAARPSGLTVAQRRRVEGWVGEGQRSKSWMAQQLGVSDRARKDHVGPLVDQLLAQRNGDGP